jgi:hypothetical protein
MMRDSLAKLDDLAARHPEIARSLKCVEATWRAYGRALDVLRAQDGERAKVSGRKRTSYRLRFKHDYERTMAALARGAARQRG